MKLCSLPTFFLLICISSTPSYATRVPARNETLYAAAKQLCRSCNDGSSVQFLYAHNVVRAAKREQPLTWDSQLESYARWWAWQRRYDCALEHSFQEGEFELGENIFWGGGSAWTPYDAVSEWASEERYYRYGSNTCFGGHECRHYTQIVWKKTRLVGCARVVCYDGDVFMTCNYYPPGNYEGERPY